MLITIYLTLFLLGFLFMILAFNFEKKEINLFFFISCILFFMIGLFSYDIETNFCDLTAADAWSCHLEAYSSPTLSYFGYGFGLIMLALGMVFTFTSIPRILSGKP